MESLGWMLTSERRMCPSIPLPSKGKETVPFCCIFKGKGAKPAPRDRAREAHPSAEFPKPPTFRPLPPAPRQLRHFPRNSGGLGPTLTEEEGAGEEQVELGRSHSSARRGRAGGQLGLAASFSSARGAQPAPRSSRGRPPAVCPTVPGASGSSASGLRSLSARVACL